MLNFLKKCVSINFITEVCCFESKRTKLMYLCINALERFSHFHRGCKKLNWSEKDV